MLFNRPPVQKDRSGLRSEVPLLWATGRQQPRFRIRAFARVSLLLSRRTAQPLLQSLAQLLREAADRVAENTLGPRFARNWRLARALPSRDAVARWLTAAATLMTAAADLAVPPTAVVPAATDAPDGAPQVPLLISRQARLAAPRLAAPLPVPREPASPEPMPATAARPGDFDAPTLAAIRAMIDDMRDPALVSPRRPVPQTISAAPPPSSGWILLTHGVPLTPAEPRAPTPGERIAGRAHGLAAGLVAGGVTLLALPVGLARAAATHLNGNDLCTWS